MKLINVLFSIAIKNCWGSTAEQVAVDGEVGFDATGGGTYETVKFLESQCPKFSWVSNAVQAEDAYSNLEIELYQFAFNDNSGAFTNSFFYHCEVSCPKIIKKIS